MQKHSPSLESEIAGLASDDPASRIHPLRQEQIKMELLRQVQNLPQDSSTILQTIQSYIPANPHSHFTKFAFVAFAAVILTGFTTIGVADAAVPGDMLYGFKLKTEKLQYDLAFTTESKAHLQTKFIENRFEEHSQAHAEVKAEDISNLNNAIQNLEDIELKLQEKGNTTAAAAVHANIERFKTRTAELEVKITPQANGKIESAQEKAEKKSEHNFKANVNTSIEAAIPNSANTEAELKIESSDKKTINLEANAHSAVSTDKLKLK